MPIVATDPYATYDPSLLGGGTIAAAITPSDTDDLATAVRKIWVGSAGALKVKTVGGSVVTFAAVPVGLFDAVRVAQVFATGTVASGLIGVV